MARLIDAYRRAVLLNSMHPVSLSGGVCSFNSDNTLKLKKLTVNIIPTQDLRGYDAPWCGGTTKNLLDETTFTNNKAIGADGSITNSTVSHYSAIVPVIAGETYTWSGIHKSSSSNNKRVHAYADGVWVEQVAYLNYSGANTQFSITFTVPAGANGIRVSDYMDDINLQIELGSVATSYIPYSNICPIVGYTGLIIEQHNKNLIDQETAPEFPYWINTSNQWTYSSGGGKSLAFPCMPNTTYTVSIQGTASVFRAGYIKDALPTNNSQTSQTYSTTRTSGPNSIVITTDSDATYIVVQIGASLLRISDLQIEFGAVGTPYVPYRKEDHSVDWTSEAGTVYWGTLNLTTGKLLVNSVYTTYDGSNDEAWEATTTSAINSKYFRIPIGNEGEIIDGEDNCLCDHYPYTLLSSSTTAVGFRAYNSSTTHKAHVGIRPNDVRDMNLTQFRALLASSPVTVCYQLTTPVEYNLTPAQMHAFLGQNNIWTDSGDITLVYWKHN